MLQSKVNELVLAAQHMDIYTIYFTFAGKARRRKSREIRDAPEIPTSIRDTQPRVREQLYHR